MNARDALVLYGAAFLLPLAATLVFTPVAAGLARRYGVLDHPGERKVHLEATPYLGGLALLVGFAVAGVLLGSTARQAAVIGICGVVVFLLGLTDDVRGLRRSTRLGVEAAVGVALWFTGVRASLFGIPSIDLLLTVAWVVAIPNAVNLLDNMDGLASGVTAIASVGYFVLAARQDDYLVAAMAAGLAGASVGFLRHNFPPARIFLGDAGSLLLGYFLAVLGLMLDLDVGSPIARMGVQGLLLAVPVFDTILVVISRMRGRRPVLLGGKDHSSHRLAKAGLGSRQVASVHYVAQVACTTIVVVAIVAAEALVPVALAWIAVAISVGVMIALRRKHHVAT